MYLITKLTQTITLKPCASAAEYTVTSKCKENFFCGGSDSFKFFMMSLMAKLIQAVTLTDPITMIKKCNGVGLSLNWIDENNDRVSRSWIVLLTGGVLTKRMFAK